jgi:hypothetical protein
VAMKSTTIASRPVVSQSGISPVFHAIIRWGFHVCREKLSFQ